jgi:hypothetical protein
LLYRIIFITIILFYLFQININIDKNAHYANIPRNLVEEEIYGEVEYFIVHNHNQSDRMFAYVRKTNSHKLDKFGQIHFDKLTSLQFIEVVGIDRCVAFFNIGQNSNYILDRERI